MDSWEESGRPFLYFSKRYYQLCNWDLSVCCFILSKSHRRGGTSFASHLKVGSRLYAGIVISTDSFSLLARHKDMTKIKCRFDLTLEMTIDAAKDKVEGHVEYRTDLFKRSTIEALVVHFEILLESVIAKPDSSIWDLQYLPAHEIRWLDSIRGVPPTILPVAANFKTAKPKIVSVKGEHLPVGIPGELFIPSIFYLILLLFCWVFLLAWSGLFRNRIF